MKIGTQLLIAALAISFIPVAIIGSVALLNGRHALSNQAFSQLNSIRQVKKAQLEEFFLEQQSDMNVLLNMVDMFRQNAYQKFQAVLKRVFIWKANKPLESLGKPLKRNLALNSSSTKKSMTITIYS